MKVEIKKPNHMLVTATDEGIIIERKGPIMLTDGAQKGTTTIPYWSIVTVNYKKPFLAMGRLQLNTLDGQKQIGNSKMGINILFTNSNKDKMADLKDFIDKKIKEVHDQKPSPSVNAVSSADELSKFKKLLDDGTITQEEFDAKKKQLLGL